MAKLADYGLGSGIDVTQQDYFLNNHGIVRRISDRNIESRKLNFDMKKERIHFKHDSIKAQAKLDLSAPNPASVACIGGVGCGYSGATLEKEYGKCKCLFY